MAPPPPHSDKLASLRAHHAATPRPEAVTDPAFTEGAPFFDAHDLMQVKYEMLRRVREDGQSVSQAARAFGFSRPTYYHAQALFAQYGLSGLVPQRPGPKRAHKLGEPIVALLHQTRAENPSCTASDLARMLRERVGLSVHPRSIERALARDAKKRPGPRP